MRVAYEDLTGEHTPAGSGALLDTTIRAGASRHVAAAVASAVWRCVVQGSGDGIGGNEDGEVRRASTPCDRCSKSR